MIRNKKDYKFYLQEDKLAHNVNRRFPLLSSNSMIWLTDPCWKFQKLLRKLEYIENAKILGGGL